MALAFCNSSHGPLAVNQVSFHSLVYFLRYAPDKPFNAKMKKGSNSINTKDSVMIVAFCTSSDGPLSMHQVSLKSLVYFQRYAPDKRFIARIKKGSNSLITVDRVMVLTLCNSPHGPLLVYQVLLNSLIYFQRYAPDKLFIVKMNK